MKKIILALTLLVLLSGCQSKDEYFTKICTLKIKSKELKDIKKEKITYSNKDIIKNIEITRTYKSENQETINYLKKSMENYNNNLLKNKNIKIKVISNENTKYVLKYFYKVDDMKKAELKKLNINKNSVKYLSKIKRKGFKCS